MTSTHKPRVLIIGIDGADWVLTRMLMQDGLLPNLQALADEGCWGPMRSTTPPTSPPAWTTIMTGKHPGGHGIFDFLPMSGESMETPIASRRGAMTLWRALSDAGMTVGTFNLPATYPPERLSGFQISGFDAPGFQPTMAEPREAFELLREAVGEYDLCPFSIQDPSGDREALVRHADLPLLATDALLKHYPCDVYMGSFQIIDWIHHGHLGREMQAGKPASLRRDGQVVGAYRLVDERVGELLERWRGEETDVIVISDHGGTSADRLVNLEKIFLERGLMAYTSRTGGGAEQVETRRSRAAKALGLWMGLKRAVPWAARLLGPLARRLRGRFSSYQEDATIDWSRTKAAPWGKYAQIRLNLRGRDPEGIVGEDEAEALREELTNLLLGLRDPDGGGPIYQEVLRGEQMYEGPFATEGPDLYAVPVEERYMTVSARSGVATLPLVDVQPDPITVLDPPWGHHSSVGIVMLAGPSAAATYEVLPESSVADVAPTVLHILGMALPDDMDGRPLLEALAPQLAQRQPEIGAPWPRPERAAQDGYADEERAMVEKRLRNLGYM